MSKGMVGAIYLLHIEKPLFHAQHYLGWTQDADPTPRVSEHLRGQGSPLVKAALAQGSTIEHVLTLPGTRDEERGLKDRHNLRGLCPKCRTKYNSEARERMRKHREALKNALHPADTDGGGRP